MTLFAAVVIVLIAVGLTDRWNQRPTLVVSTRSGEAIRGRRALALPFTLVDAELILEERTEQLGGRVVIPRRNLTLIQALPRHPLLEVAEA